MPAPPRGPASLLASLDLTLGRAIRPGELVLLGWTDDAPDQVALVTLDAIESEPDEEVAAVRQLVADGATTAAAVLSSHLWGRAEWQLRFVGACAARFGLDLLDAVSIVGDRWRSTTCRDLSCCPPDGRPLPRAMTRTETS